MNEEEIFHKVLARSPEERAAYLEQACAGDPPLRAAVEALLRANVGASGFLEQPALAPAATVDEQPVREKLGTVIGPYKLMEKIGEGGMGLVFVAEQQQPVRRKVALKVIKPGMDTRQVVARFEAERQALALMDHPYIAKVLDGGETTSGRPYFVMELVKGVPITEYCDQNRVPVRERLELFLHVCQAVQHAHQKGIIHRDIKPSNVLVMSHDGTPLVKVIDFGVAKAIGKQLTDKTIYTQFSQMVGTPLYMSPEQAGQSGLDVDTRSDIYSLGVLLYELLTGTTPFDKERLKEAGYEEIRRIIREEEPVRPSTRISTLGKAAATISTNRKSEPRQLSRLCRGELDWIVMKALEKDRNRRYETANGFAMDVQRYLNDEPVQACPPSAWYRFRKFARRRKVALAAGATVSASLVLAVVVLAVSNVRIRAEEKAKEEEYMGRIAAVEAKRQTAYFRQVSVAMSEWQAARVARADQLLKECPEDLRGWEWHYLKRLCHENAVLYWPDRFKRLWVWQLPQQISQKETRSAELSVSGKVVRSLFSADGRRAAVLDSKFILHVFDTESVREVASFLIGEPASGFSGVLSPDGRYLARLHYKIDLFDTTAGKAIALLQAELPKGMESEKPFYRITHVAFSPNGREVAGANERGHVFVWDRATGQQRLHISTRNKAAEPYTQSWVTWSPDGRWLASCSIDDGVVKLWDARTGKQLQALGPGQGFSRVVFSPGGQWVAAVHSEEAVWIWDPRTGQRRQILSGPMSHITNLAFSPDEQLLAWIGPERSAVTLWDIATGRVVGAYPRQGTTPEIDALAFSPDGKHVLSLGKNEKVLRSWDAASGPQALALRGRSFRAALSPDGKWLATAGHGGAAQLWDAESGAELGRFGDAVDAAVAFSPDGTSLATAATLPDGTGSVRIWDAQKRELRRALCDADQKQAAPCDALAFSPDGTRLAAAERRQALRIWDPRTGKLLVTLGRLADTVTGLAFSRDGRTLLTVAEELKRRDTATGKELLTLRVPGKGPGAALSPDGAVVAVTCVDNSVRLFDGATGKELRVLIGHTNVPSSVAFSPDGRRIATGGGADETVKLWDATTGEEILTVGRHPGRITDVAFSSNGNRIVSTSLDDVRVWDATPLAAR
jgi:WD40 repeat protein/serine/threonine protein kinase